MGKSGSTSVSWSKLWNVAWWPGLKETRGPVALAVLMILSVYLFLDLYLFLVVVDNSPPGVTLPISMNTSESPCHASPFCVITTKSLFLGPLDFYVHKPIAIIINRAWDLDAFMSANFVSVSHIALSVFSVRLLAHESLCIRRLGVLVFEVRNLLDSLDGVIARATAAKLNDAQHLDYYIAGGTDFSLNGGAAAAGATQNSNNKMNLSSANLVGGAPSQGSAFGYYIDGICDGVGCICLMIGCAFYLQRHPHRQKSAAVAYSPLSLVTVNGNPRGSNNNGNNDDSIIATGKSNSKVHSPKSETHSLSKVYVKKDKDEEPVVSLNLKPKSLYFLEPLFTKVFDNVLKDLAGIRAAITCRGVGAPAFLILIQMFLSSVSWNRNIIIYTKLVERSPADKSDDITFKNNMIHSTMMWLVIYLWRTINPLNMTELVLIAIFFDRIPDLLHFFQYSGFLIIAFVTFLSEIHHNDLFRHKE